MTRAHTRANKHPRDVETGDSLDSRCAWYRAVRSGGDDRCAAARRRGCNGGIRGESEFTTLILVRAFFTSSLSVKAYNFESHELVFPKLRTSGPIRRAKGGWTSSDETLRQAVCKFNGKSWKKIDGNATLYTHSCSGRYVLAQHLQVDSLLKLDQLDIRLYAEPPFGV
ncbi:hypothetical protein DY000_02047266 [Brassica cretica]|uniref:Uncharacterized protein n=1 Tax=Brassica cretica TaxID=69181 RepID=A0ABQ7F141_BRACR|nr:hypothetical protein DY000_02047266 [Brassica cretica]